MSAEQQRSEVAVVLKVNVEDLVASGVTVTGHGEDVAMKHNAADTRIETAQGGWQGRSAASMTLRLAAWSTTTTALLTRLSDHAQGLHSCAQEFCAMEERHAEALEEPGRQADSIATRM
ncbi:WXG100 family type VII secretion target [Mycolicibacterium mengxianglii]|uniref:WXG100 family type VII secretion target n=1 Tax=Mycolicibacterium mengxianglii TaxID=2736649 RepID=UPI0018D1DD59|nr:WXG100 family type VII secretion target [Mycolicibacterium mengxianglii]